MLYSEHASHQDALADSSDPSGVQSEHSFLALAEASGEVSLSRYEMYCVIRFLDRSGNIDLETIGESLNRYREGVYDGLAISELHAFSCSVSRSDYWGVQREAMRTFVEDFEASINDAQSIGVEVYFDLAVDHKDYLDRYLTSYYLDSELVEFLANHRLGFVFSIYSDGPRPSDSGGV